MKGSFGLLIETRSLQVQMQAQKLGPRLRCAQKFAMRCFYQLRSGVLPLQLAIKGDRLGPGRLYRES